MMLQIALLLLGCALSRYLWEINIIVASVVLGVTSFGAIFYTLIVVACTASESCPYQTPGAQILRRTLPIAASSWCYRWLIRWWSSFERPWYSKENILLFLLFLPCMLIAAAMDVCYPGRAILQSSVAPARTVYRWVMNTSPRMRTPDQQSIALGTRCVSWMLQTSLDKTVHLMALEHLATMMTLAEFNPTIVADCFNVFISCINVGGYETVIVHGSEQLAMVSIICFLRTFNRLSAVDPTSSILEDIRRRYRKVFPEKPKFSDLPLRYMMDKIDSLVKKTRFTYPTDTFNIYRPFPQECIPLARGIAEGAQAEYQQTGRRKAPRWTLGFALHSLSLDPLHPTSVIADCLSIIAIDLDCDAMGTRFTASDERCVHSPRITTTLTLNQCTSGANFEVNSSETQNNG